MSSRIYLGLFTVIAMFASSGNVSAQARNSETFSFALAISDSFSYSNANAVIIRRVAGNPRDVVLLRSDATAQLVGAAVEELGRIRAAFGDAPVQNQIYVVRRTAPVRAGRSSENYLRKLLLLEAKELAGIGNARYMLLGMPRQSP